MESVIETHLQPFNMDQLQQQQKKKKKKETDEMH
jgi:hypothetical protein